MMRIRARQGQLLGYKKNIMFNFRLSKLQNQIFWLLVIVWGLAIGYWNLPFLFAQDNDLEFTLDIASSAVPLPKIFKPGIDLSGRGWHRSQDWPQQLAAEEALGAWQKDIGFKAICRLQYNLWEIAQLSKDKAEQDKLRANYEAVIKNISDAGGIVILDIFGTPAGLGKALDKKSAPWNLKVFKELVKGYIKELSKKKKYNIWYEVWSAPDLDDFFLGRKQEYLNMYRVVAEAVMELEAETKIYIPLGGPSASWWFQDTEGNTIVTPERSLIYELIKFCAQYKLPLNFISWHAYSTDPRAEKESTIYSKNPPALIRDWLTYFNLDRNTPLILDEWNYDNGINISAGRKENSYIAASFIPARLKNMHEAGVDYQSYFSLEDFQNNKEGVARNVGIFEFDSESSHYKGAPKPIYNVFKMLNKLGSGLFSSLKLNDEFSGVIPTKEGDSLAVLIYNYTDPDIWRNYLSRNISTLNPAERKTLLNLVRSGKIDKVMRLEMEVAGLRIKYKKVNTLLLKAKELKEQALKAKTEPRNIKMEIKGLKENYLYQRYVVDSSCNSDCAFSPVEEKEIDAPELYQETLALKPYSVNLIVLNKKPKENLEPVAPEVLEASGGQPATTDGNSAR